MSTNPLPIKALLKALYQRQTDLGMPDTELAKALGLSETWVRIYRRADRVPTQFRLGTREKIEQFLEQTKLGECAASSAPDGTLANTCILLSSKLADKPNVDEMTRLSMKILHSQLEQLLKTA